MPRVLLLLAAASIAASAIATAMGGPAASPKAAAAPVVPQRPAAASGDAASSAAAASSSASSACPIGEDVALSSRRCAGARFLYHEVVQASSKRKREKGRGQSDVPHTSRSSTQAGPHTTHLN